MGLGGCTHLRWVGTTSTTQEPPEQAAQPPEIEIPERSAWVPNSQHLPHHPARLQLPEEVRSDLRPPVSGMRRRRVLLPLLALLSLLLQAGGLLRLFLLP